MFHLRAEPRDAHRSQKECTKPTVKALWNPDCRRTAHSITEHSRNHSSALTAEVRTIKAHQAFLSLRPVMTTNSSICDLELLTLFEGTTGFSVSLNQNNQKARSLSMRYWEPFLSRDPQGGSKALLHPAAVCRHEEQHPFPATPSGATQSPAGAEGTAHNFCISEPSFTEEDTEKHHLEPSETLKDA